MNKNKNWKTLVLAELEQAKTARQIGNEGKARVCARRAAGIAIGEYVANQNLPNPGRSAYDRLKFIASHPEVTPRAREISQHLILRVNEEFRLPAETDLIAETYELIQTLVDPSFSAE